MKVIDTSDSSAYVFHTRRECPYYPDDVRPLTEADERRSVRKCEACADLETEAALEW